MKDSYVMYRINECGRHYLRLIYDTCKEELCLFDKSVEKPLCFFVVDGDDFEELIKILDSQKFFVNSGRSCDELSRNELIINDISIK